MTWPNNDDFVEDEPMSEPMRRSRTGQNARGRLRQTSRKVSTAAGDTWKQTKEKAGVACDRTESFLRENPVPTILGALAIGLAIGLAIRYAANSDERRDVEVKSPLGDANLSFLSLPFLWPFFKLIRERYEDSAEAVRGSVGRLKKIDIDDYAKPIRKRWKSWTH
jgi:ElaB/YqjD/DUF883 family membrane-anchored ribosome-binding protein